MSSTNRLLKVLILSCAVAGIFARGQQNQQGAPYITNLGDSLTAGAEGVQPTTYRYPSVMQNLTATYTINAGIGGQTAQQIAVRANAYAGTANQQFASAFTIPTSGSVTVTFPSGYEPCYFAPQNASPLYQSGVPLQFTVSGTTYYANCTDNGSHVYSLTFTNYPSSPVNVPSGTQYLATAPVANWLNGKVIIWAGRNGFSTCPTSGITTQNCPTAAAIQAIVNSLPTGAQYTVLSILNAEDEPFRSTNYQIIKAINAWEAATFGSNYYDIRSWLVGQYNASLPLDANDYANDVLPASLRAEIASGTLQASVSSTTTCNITLGTTVVAHGAIVSIGSEFIEITGGSDGAYTCNRGYVGTTPATYSSGTAWYALDALHLGNNPTTPAGQDGYVIMGTQATIQAIQNAVSPVVTVSTFGQFKTQPFLMTAPSTANFPSFADTGALYQGTTPYWYINQGTTQPTFSANGTEFAINAPASWLTGCASGCPFLDFFENGTEVYSLVGNNGTVKTFTDGYTLAPSNNGYWWVNGTTSTSARDTALCRASAGTVYVESGTGCSNNYGTFQAAAVQPMATTVASLPSASSSAGQIRTVSDSTTVSTEGQTCTGGGTNTAIAISNGSVWKCF